MFHHRKQSSAHSQVSAKLQKTHKQHHPSPQRRFGAGPFSRNGPWRSSNRTLPSTDVFHKHTVGCYLARAPGPIRPWDRVCGSGIKWVNVTWSVALRSHRHQSCVKVKAGLFSASLCFGYAFSLDACMKNWIKFTLYAVKLWIKIILLCLLPLLYATNACCDKWNYIFYLATAIC